VLPPVPTSNRQFLRETGVHGRYALNSIFLKKNSPLALICIAISGSVERSERHVGIMALGRLAAALGVSLAEFFAPFRHKFRR
jgi:hypothetical protein